MTRTHIVTPDGTIIATIPGLGTISGNSLAEIDAEARRRGVHHHSHSRAASPLRREQPGEHPPVVSPGNLSKQSETEAA